MGPRGCGLAQPLSPWAARGGAGGRGGAERAAICAAAAAETIVRIVARGRWPAEPDGRGPSLSRSGAQDRCRDGRTDRRDGSHAAPAAHDPRVAPPGPSGPWLRGLRREPILPGCPRPHVRLAAAEPGNQVSGTPPGVRPEVGKAASRRLFLATATDLKLVDRSSVCRRDLGGGCLLWAALFYSCAFFPAVKL